MSDGSAGADGVPTRFLKYMSQSTVAAPEARASAASCGPPVATTTPGRPKRSPQNDTEPSAKSIQTGCASERPHEIAAESVAVPAAGNANGATMQAARARSRRRTPVTATRKTLGGCLGSAKRLSAEPPTGGDPGEPGEVPPDACLLLLLTLRRRAARAPPHRRHRRGRSPRR